MSRGLTCSQETTVVQQPFISYQHNSNQITSAVVKNISAPRLYLISHSSSGNLCSLKWTVTEIAVKRVSLGLTMKCEWVCVRACCFVRATLSLIRGSLYRQREKSIVPNHSYLSAAKCHRRLLGGHFPNAAETHGLLCRWMDFCVIPAGKHCSSGAGQITLECVRREGSVTSSSHSDTYRKGMMKI